MAEWQEEPLETSAACEIFIPQCIMYINRGWWLESGLKALQLFSFKKLTEGASGQAIKKRDSDRYIKILLILTRNTCYFSLRRHAVHVSSVDDKGAVW